MTKAQDMLEKHQWAGTSYGSYGSTARTCPECGGMHPKDSIHLGRPGKHREGQGHEESCLLKATLEEEDT